MPWKDGVERSVATVAGAENHSRLPKKSKNRSAFAVDLRPLNFSSCHFFFDNFLVHSEQEPVHCLHVFYVVYNQQEQLTSLFKPGFVGACLQVGKYVFEEARL